MLSFYFIVLCDVATVSAINDASLSQSALLNGIAALARDLANHVQNSNQAAPQEAIPDQTRVQEYLRYMGSMPKDPRQAKREEQWLRLRREALSPQAQKRVNDFLEHQKSIPQDPRMEKRFQQYENIQALHKANAEAYAQARAEALEREEAGEDPIPEDTLVRIYKYLQGLEKLQYTSSLEEEDSL